MASTGAQAGFGSHLASSERHPPPRQPLTGADPWAQSREDLVNRVPSVYRSADKGLVFDELL